VATILLAGVDPVFREKLDGLLAVHHLITTDNVDKPDLILADIGRVDPVEVCDNYPDIPILGFTGHADAARTRTAFTAGFDRVVERSALLEQVDELISELTAPLQ
jgi:CheY-like chemotaxis protein